VTLSECPFESGDKLAAEYAAQHSAWKKETIPRTYPGFVIGSQATRGDHAMEVRMMEQILSPGMKDTKETHLGSKVFRIRSNLQKRCSACSEQ